MKFLDIFKKKPEKKEEKKEIKKASTATQSPPTAVDRTCAYCGNGGADRKWAGQYWHKQCIRQAKKEAKSMI